MVVKYSFRMNLALALAVLFIFFAVGTTGCGSKKEDKQNAGIAATRVESTPAVPLKKFKILHVMSYHSPWSWTDSQLDGFKEALKDLNVEYKVYQMNTKNNDSEEWKRQAGKEARDLIDSWKPDLVYTSDDDAQKYVAAYYVNSNIPFVFSAVNEDPAEYGFTGSKNITGVLEVEHFVESVKLLKEIVPDVKKIAVVIDEAPMWDPVVKRMKDQLSKVPGVEFPIWDKILTFNEYKQKMQEYPKTVDAIALLGVFNFKGENGRNVPYQDVLMWTAQNSMLPDFSFWEDRISFGTLCAVTVSGYEQGLAAGRMARGILVEGKSPSGFAMVPTTKGETVISLARAKKLGIKINSKTLLSAKVKKDFLWGK